MAQQNVESERVTACLDSDLFCFPNRIGVAYQASGCRFGKEDMHSRSLRSGQEFGDSVPDASVKKGMHIFFTLRSVPCVATHIGLVNWMVRVTRHFNSVLAFA